MSKLKEILELLEKHGLVNKILDKLLTPENMEALGRGIARGLKEN